MNSVKLQDTGLTYRICIFLSTNNEISERKSKKTIPFTIESKWTKYLGINLPKEVKDTYSESYKTLIREIEDDSKKQKNIPWSWIGRINIVNMTLLPKAVYITDLMQSPAK